MARRALEAQLAVHGGGAVAEQARAAVGSGAADAVVTDLEPQHPAVDYCRDPFAAAVLGPSEGFEMHQHPEFTHAGTEAEP
jgi:hypothetical protein